MCIGLILCHFSTFRHKCNVTDIIVDFTIFHQYNAVWWLFFKAYFMLSRSICVNMDAVCVVEWIYWLLISHRLGTTSNCSTTANLHNSQITTALFKVFQPAVSSPAVPCQRLLTVKILQLPLLRSFHRRLPNRTACPSATRLTLLITFRH
jgi:hypothetical protein